MSAADTRERLRRFFIKRWKQGGQILLHSPFHPLYLWIFRPQHSRRSQNRREAIEYRHWVEREQASLPSREWHRERAQSWRVQPLVSIVVPTYRPQKEWLDQAIASVQNQSYENWQLCICDDCSGEAWLREYLEAAAASDPRIRVTFSEVNRGIAAALNEAARLATGDYVCFLDHDDELHPYALHYVVEAIQEPGVDLLYTDEDHLDVHGQRIAPTFKPDFSPELLQCCMYFGHLLVASRGLIEQVGWFRPGFDGAQDYDFALRLVERAHTVRHLPRMLYHWRQHAQSTSMNPKAKPYAHEAGRRALESALERRGIPGTVDDGPLMYTFYIRRPRSQSTVSVVLCPTDARRFERFLDAWRRSSTDRARLIVVEEPGRSSQSIARLAEQAGCSRVRHAGGRNLPGKLNTGAAAGGTDHLVFLDEFLVPKRPEWLEHLSAHLDRPEIGAVGGRVLDSAGAIVHAGMAVGIFGAAGSPGRGIYATDLMYYLALPRDVSAVSGACLGIRRELFEQAGRFNPAFPTYFDVDICLRLQLRSARVVIDPRIEMITSKSDLEQYSALPSERLRLAEFCRAAHPSGDPYYPRAFDRTSEEIRLQGDS